VEGYYGVVKSGTHTFLPTERVHFGAGSIRKLAEEARAKARAFVVTGRTLHEKTDLVRRVEAILGRKHAGTFVGMSEHAPGSVVEKAAKGARGSGFLVSLGDGSVIDGTKAVARELGYPKQVAVPTTLSGAEWAHRVGVTDEAAGRKGGFTDPSAVPQVVILDPEATLFTPEKLWLSTRIRALDHAVEGFLFGGEHPITDGPGSRAPASSWPTCRVPERSLRTSRRGWSCRSPPGSRTSGPSTLRWVSRTRWGAGSGPATRYRTGSPPV
jgi:maleylacetate reductase